MTKHNRRLWLVLLDGSVCIYTDIDVRVIEVTLDDGSKEYLATNLFDPLITQTMFQDLYFYRWPVETKYKELKSRLSLEEFSGATTVSVFQEFFINMLLSNLASLNQADIRNPLRYLLITECCFAAYQEWLAPLLIQASPNPLLIALRN